MSQESRALDDIELVERAQHGQVSAYEELVRRHQESAFWAAYVITRDADAAKDAAQSGFIKAYYALARVRHDAPFRPWLLKIVSNEARNQARSAGRRVNHELRLGENRPWDDAAPSPEPAVLAGFNREELLRAVNSLSEKDRQAIGFRYFLDLSEAEMAISMGCARGTVKSRLSRALGRLRESLSRDPLEPGDGGREGS